MTAPLVVVGDALLDIDLDGHATRLAPDAPAPVVDDPVERLRPGGAALAACLAARHEDRPVVLVTALPDDDDADRLAALVAEAGVRLVRLRREGTTTVKRRVRADGVTLVRLDTGTAGAVHEPAPEALEVVRAAATVVASDYGRGLLAVPAVRAAIAEAARRCPVVWDPHPRGAEPVPGVRLVVPNRSETLAGGGGAGGSDLAHLHRRATALRTQWSAHAVAVTLGPRGALLCQGDGTPAVVPAPPVQALDVCGAGDRFAVAAAGALADGALVSEAVQRAVDLASSFVGSGGASSYGATPPAGLPHLETAAEVIERVRAAGGTVVATGGCFDLLHAGHVATLQAARALGDCLVVCLNSDSSVRSLKGPTRPLQGQADRATVLSALAAVDAVVVFDEASPEAVLSVLRPDVWVKGGDYSVENLPEARLLEEWGGQAVVVPFLRGRSTTSLVAAAGGGGAGDAGGP